MDAVYVVGSVVGVIVAIHVWKRLTAPGLNLNNKHVIITGGSTGLGLAVAIKVPFVALLFP
jgi:3-dehydrosphinganine reductase